ncbi:alpha/beta hydrolase family protein [Streptomyces flavofungini]|uniref:Alpha/beta hydrolase n=1 Tax=Streptomyces flavofungini TaxID=68200 RepID=A0ABS0WXS5_9ACTN|nr:alpha/beta hydrolase [Streptomyces flavofungini]MBJ3805688.1 alpha/beta hydrolase [Streptomyces flavofungini]GHC72369.1 lipase [Streptomyces flavofungini]
MPDDAAVARDAAEQDSAFAHPAAPPDATAPYGPHADQIVDFYAPRGAADRPAPLVVLLHGGAWRAPYDRAHVSPFADFLARRGFAVASVEYRRGTAGGLVPAQGGGDGPVAGRWPDTLDDVAAALDALPGLVRTALPAADPHRVVLTGHSAGGHLALWAAARHVLPEGSPWHRERPTPLRGVVALAPLGDLRVADELGVCSGAVRQFLGATGSGADAADADARFEERLAHADPAALLPTGIATTVVQGRTDIVVPQAVSEAYADAAAKAGEVVGLTLLEDVGHFPLIDPAADACAVVAEEIAQLAF